ncbi:hypothetical protein TcasGA2_TC005049 [Tribolium castaneum]|uniref:Endonuclease/exonuclease/phosphatase domain-containing protein n=1 Tax=Tribolium castaneum TaxID=7070 RepID=D7EKU3_TRICA|nr:hypothetical protein TcasGA2_TC005049 [Tribolium castaneum]
MGGFSPPRNYRHLDDRSRSTSSSRSSSGSLGFQSSSEILELPQNLTVCQLNIEGILKDKCDFLSKMALKKRIDVIVLQESHTSEMDFFLVYKFLVTPCQHRPVIVKIGNEIKQFLSLQKPEWNFQKAKWNEFAKQVDGELRWIPPTSINYHRFDGAIKNAAKKFISRRFRRNYVPCWSDETKSFYNAYASNPNPENADAVLNSFNKASKEKWNNLMEDLNFTHSSRSSWKLLQKLGSSNITQPKIDFAISPNAVASRLVNVSNSVKLEKKAKKEMKPRVQKQRKKIKVLEELSRCFNVDELKAAISSTKSKKSAGFDGFYPEFIEYLGSFALK